jgi:hypothetical protein
MDLELHLSERTVDENVSDLLKAKINLRPKSWVNDFPSKGMRTLQAVVRGVEEIEQKRIQLHKGKVYRDLQTGRMFAVHRENKNDFLTFINIAEKK